MIKKFFTLIFCLTVMHTSAQTLLKGKITDFQNVPVANVIVSIIPKDTSKAIRYITDNLGFFNVEVKKNESYRLKFSSLNFLDTSFSYTTKTDTDFLHITLS